MTTAMLIKSIMEVKPSATAINTMKGELVVLRTKISMGRKIAKKRQ